MFARMQILAARKNQNSQEIFGFVENCVREVLAWGEWGALARLSGIFLHLGLNLPLAND
jgi:hypothetical protein